jgi:hypothetical protein
MPADAPGVTTDDKGPGRDSDSDQSSAPTGNDPSESAATAADRDETTTETVAGRGSETDGAPDGPATGPSAGAGTGTNGWPDPAPDHATSTTQPAPEPGPEPGPAGLAGGEPPPAPVLTAGLAGRERERRGLHLRQRTDRASKRGLRVNQRLWSIDPWSVFKVSALFYLCLGLIILVAGTLLYNAGRRVGTIDQAESFVTRMGAYGECVPKADVGKGVEFEEDDDKCEEGEVLVGGFTLDDSVLFRAAAIGGAVLVVAGSIGNVLLTVLLNLLNELTGGLRHTVVKEPVARPQGSGSARSPGRARRLPVGSPRRRPPG